jgi:hypothetical protein
VAVTKTKQLPLFEQFFAVRRFSSALTFSVEGGQLLFASNISGQFNLWRVPVEGGWPDQLTTFSDETVRGAGVSPRDGTIVLCADQDGDEFHQLYVIEGGKGAAGSALRRQRGLVARRHQVRLCGERAQADGHGMLGARRGERRGAAGVRRGEVLLPRCVLA